MTLSSGEKWPFSMRWSEPRNKINLFQRYCCNNLPHPSEAKHAMILHEKHRWIRIDKKQILNDMKMNKVFSNKMQKNWITFSSQLIMAIAFASSWARISSSISFLIFTFSKEIQNGIKLILKLLLFESNSETNTTTYKLLNGLASDCMKDIVLCKLIGTVIRFEISLGDAHY